MRMLGWLTSMFNKHERRMVFVIGLMQETQGSVQPTPQFKRFPILSLGDYIVAFQMTDSQKTTVTVVFTDKKGNPAPVDGVPEWLVDNPNVLALAPAADGKSCDISAVGPLGTGIVTLNADADLGAGVTQIQGTLEIEITGGMAQTVALTPGTPVEQ